ncbi:MAG: hypothetical protein WCF84_26750 [Anaerolineae bacterium]
MSDQIIYIKPYGDGDAVPIKLHDNGDGTYAVATTATVAGGGDASAAKQDTQIAAEQAIQATAGATTGAAVTTDSNGTLQQYLRGLVKLLAAKVGVTVADGDSATLGVTTGAAVTTDATGTVQQYLRGLVKLLAAKIGVTVAAGDDVTEGNTTDAAIVTDTTGTVSGKIRGLVKWAFERMPAALGQGTKAQSLPVVLPSDQTVTISVADGSDVTLGAKADAAQSDQTQTASLVALVKGIIAALKSLVVLAAGENHVGAVGGNANKKTVEFTRPADTTAYAALDVIGVNLAVSGATNATPIVITCATHGLADGDPVTIASVGGNTNANGNYYAKVTGYSTTTFGVYSDKALTTPVAGNSNYTSGGTVARLFRMPSLSRVAGGSGYVVKVRVTTDQKAEVWRPRLHLFHTPVAAILDNSPYLALWANRANRVGYVDLPALSTEDPTSSTQTNALATPNTSASNLPLKILCANGDADLYFMVETRDAFTPVSGANIYVEIAVEND